MPKGWNNRTLRRDRKAKKREYIPGSCPIVHIDGKIAHKHTWKKMPLNRKKCMRCGIVRSTLPPRFKKREKRRSISPALGAKISQALLPKAND